MIIINIIYNSRKFKQSSSSEATLLVRKWNLLHTSSKCSENWDKGEVQSKVALKKINFACTNVNLKKIIINIKFLKI